MGRYIDPRSQYFDDAGDPLIAGKVFIKNSGSAEDKDLFFDSAHKQPAPNPVTLSASGRMPNTFFSGSAKAILTNSNGMGQGNQFWEVDPIFSTSSGQGGFEDWNSKTVWNHPDVVVGSDDRFYMSITNGNEDNDPTTDDVSWEEVEFTSIWNPNIDYSLTPRPDTVKASDGNFYKNLLEGNSGNDPVSSDTWTAAVDITGSTLARTYASALSF